VSRIRSSRVAITPKVVCELGFRFLALRQLQHVLDRRKVVPRKQKSIAAQERGRDDKRAAEIPATSFRAAPGIPPG
jgi:hypothetical protein